MNSPEATLLRSAAGADIDPSPMKESDRAAPSRWPNNLPPMIILGGEANALSVARQLGRLGVCVYALGEAESVVRSSRFARWIAPPLDGGLEASWARWLLGPGSDDLKGAVLLACGDAGIRVIARHRDALLSRFILDDSNPTAQLAMLNKMTTYQNAVAAGVPTPQFWIVESRDQVLALRDELVFPLIVKPRMSHVFEEKFGKKYLHAPSFEEALKGIDAASAAGVDVVLMEYIPGPDARLCSYFTYLDEHGQPLFHFTKRVIRRYPAGMGPACYHITDWIPDLVEPSLKLFRHVGLRGLANVEYKQDERDGSYKLIECNARFVASNALVATAGFDLAAFVYNRLTGRPQAPLEKFRSGMRMWDPGRDWTAFRELRAAGQITFAQWIRSISHRQTFPWFNWTDPMPAVARLIRGLKK
jgi:predicted ATP-grasp superfamily ATP-dependent carboligase